MIEAKKMMSLECEKCKHPIEVHKHGECEFCDFTRGEC